MLNVLDKVKTTTIVLLTLLCGYLLYTRPTILKQETKITAETVSNDKTAEVDTVTTVTDIKPSGEKIIKKTQVISKIADKKIVSEKVTDIHDDSELPKPGLNNQPCYSLGLEFPVLPTSSKTPKSIQLGYRVLGNAWITTSVGLTKNPDVTVGIRLDF